MGNSDTAEIFGLADADIDAALTQVQLPPLLAALYVLSGNRELISFEEADQKLVNHFPAPHGGMSAEEQAKARAISSETIKSLRDGTTPIQPITSPAVDEALVFLRKFLMGKAADEQIELMRLELGLEDLDAPNWNVDQYSFLPGFTVAVIGAGIAGLAMAHRLKQAGMNVTVFEKQDEVGGVWWQNRYPGCRLDTDNLAYSLSFAQKTTWTNQFSTRDDILSYLKDFALENGVRDDIRFETQVKKASYDSDTTKWTVVTEQRGVETSSTFDAVIAAVGSLNRPVIPEIDGLKDFKGQMFHTAEWPEDLDLAGKSVAVVGTGASAYQVVPAIAAEVESLTLFQRSAPWASPTPHYHLPYPQEHFDLLQSIPGYAEWLRLFQFWNAVEGRLEYARVDPGWDELGSVSPASKALREVLTQHTLRQYEGSPQLHEAVIPNYPPYGKRLLRDNGVWAEALQRPNVSLVPQSVSAMTSNGIVAGGQEYQVDVVIFATGFDASNVLPEMEIRGENGVEMHDYWAGEPRAYYGVSVPGFPNFFMSLGPNTGFVANGSVIFLAECATRYVLNILKTAFDRGATAVAPTEESYLGLNAMLDADNKTMAWGVDQSANWYKNKSGRVTMVWPRPVYEYWKATRDVRAEEHNFSKSNGAVKVRNENDHK